MTRQPGRVSPASAIARRTRCTRPSGWVTVPSFSAYEPAGKITFACSARPCDSSVACATTVLARSSALDHEAASAPAAAANGSFALSGSTSSRYTAFSSPPASAPAIASALRPSCGLSLSPGPALGSTPDSRSPRPLLVAGISSSPAPGVSASDSSAARSSSARTRSPPTAPAANRSPHRITSSPPACARRAAVSRSASRSSPEARCSFMPWRRAPLRRRRSRIGASISGSQSSTSTPCANSRSDTRACRRGSASSRCSSSASAPFARESRCGEPSVSRTRRPSRKPSSLVAPPPASAAVLPAARRSPAAASSNARSHPTGRSSPPSRSSGWEMRMAPCAPATAHALRPPAPFPPFSPVALNFAGRASGPRRRRASERQSARDRKASRRRPRRSGARARASRARRARSG